MRYDRELVQTTVKAMKRIADIKKRREHTFWKNRYGISNGPVCCAFLMYLLRMAASREKLLAHRRKKLGEKTSIKLVKPISMEVQDTSMVREKIKVPTKSRSALVPGEGRSMGMEVD